MGPRYVDARTGRVLRSEQQIETIDGSGQTLYSGTVPLSVTKSGSTYQLKNDGVRGGTYTTDIENPADSQLCQAAGFGCEAGTLITSTSAVLGNGGKQPGDGGRGRAVRLHRDLGLLPDTFGRNGIFGTGKGSFNRVH